jgi:hypothetical protein
MSAVATTGPASIRHVHLYAFAWLGYFVVLALLPVQYGTLQAITASLGLLLWVGISVLAAYLTHHAFSAKGLVTSFLRPSAGRPLRAPQLERLVWLALVMSIIGFLCLSYDRIAIQGIDFSQGIVVARELWRRSGEGREGVSSIFSVLGYLLGFSFFVATTLAHLHWEFLTRRTRWGAMVIAPLLVAANSLLTGGRSIVLIQLASIVATCGIRAMLGLRMMPGRGARIWLGATLALIISVGYSLYVFSARAGAGNIPPERYVTGMLGYLGGQPTHGFYRLNDLPAPVAATAQFATVAGAYLTHSYGTFETVLEMQTTPGTVSFGFVRELLAKSGIGQVATENPLLSGRFLSLPGSLWYDFGWVGFYAGALVVGVLIGLAPRLIAVREGGGISLVVCMIILITGLVAPLVVSIDILSVPFLVLGFLQVDLVNRMLAGPGNWLWVSRPVREAYLEDCP